MNSKTKTGLSISTELLELEASRRNELGFTSRSELFETAVREYISKREMARFADTAATVYEQIEAHAMHEFEERMAKLMFKIAIELAQNNLMFANLFELDERVLYELRKQAQQLVRESNGRVSFDKAVNFAEKNSVQIRKKTLLNFLEDDD